MLSNQIQAWFKNGKPYSQGVALYRQTGGAYSVVMFERYIGARYIPKNILQRLSMVLSKYLQTNPLVDQAPLPRDQNDTTRTIVQYVPNKKIEPSEITQLREKAKLLHKRHAFLHAQLSILESDEERYEVAKEIMEEVIPTLDSIYDQIRVFEKEGKLPIPEKEKRAVDLLNKRNSLRSRISRLKSILKKDDLESTKKTKYQKELLAKEILLQKIENELNA